MKTARNIVEKYGIWYRIKLKQKTFNYFVNLEYLVLMLTKQHRIFKNLLKSIKIYEC